MNKPKQIELEVVTWTEAGVRKYKPMTIIRPDRRSPYSELLLKHLVTNFGVSCFVNGSSIDLDFIPWLREVTNNNCVDIQRGSKECALLVTEPYTSVDGWIEDLESTNRLDYVLLLVLRITEVTMESVLDGHIDLPLKDDEALSLWKMMMEDKEDRLYSYEEVRFIEDWALKTNIGYMRALSCRHLYNHYFGLDDANISEILRKYYVAPCGTHSSNAIDMLYRFRYYPFRFCLWAGVEECVSTLMRLYEIDGERVLRAVKSGPAIWTTVLETCPSLFTCDEIGDAVKNKSENVRSIIYDIIKAWGKLAMQETGLPEEVQCDLPYAKEFL